MHVCMRYARMYTEKDMHVCMHNNNVCICIYKQRMYIQTCICTYVCPTGLTHVGSSLPCDAVRGFDSVPQGQRGVLLQTRGGARQQMQVLHRRLRPQGQRRGVCLHARRHRHPPRGGGLRDCSFGSRLEGRTPTTQRAVAGPLPTALPHLTPGTPPPMQRSPRPLVLSPCFRAEDGRLVMPWAPQLMSPRAARAP